MPVIRIQRFLESAARVKVLVAGDVMLDAYVSGSASRISPEGPVPVVNVAHRRYLAGGAANVAANIMAVGSQVWLAGATGIDEAGIRLRAELEQNGAGLAGLIEDDRRRTTTKTRVTAGGQQIVRFDEEDLLPLSGPAETALCARCSEILPEIDVCIISDYAKGIISDSFCAWLIGEAAKRNKPVVVDPKSRDFGRYRGATVVTPNLKEAGEAAGGAIHDDGELTGAVKLLLPKIAPAALLVTRGQDGMSLFERNSTARHLPAIRNEVADVTGAGDTVAAILGIALGMGMTLFDAANIANIAAGVAVSHAGTWAVKREELAEAAAQFELSAAALQ